MGERIGSEAAMRRPVVLVVPILSATGAAAEKPTSRPRTMRRAHAIV
jgi:hypothetical protein